MRVKNVIITGTRYKQIAVDLAQQIADGFIPQGTKLKGRSVLASNYNVSPETVRKSMAMLEEMDVVKIIPNSGNLVLSKEKAKDFINRFDERENMKNLKNDLTVLMEEKELLEEKINNTMRTLLDQSFFTSNRYKEFLLGEILLKGSLFINKTVEDSKFWESTGGTIVAIKRDDSLIVSPSPKETLLEEDIIVYIKDKRNYY